MVKSEIFKRIVEQTWSTKLEAIARSFARRCVYEHNSRRSSSVDFYVGENLYASTGKTLKTKP
jgi:hypothetical protein